MLELIFKKFSFFFFFFPFVLFSNEDVYLKDISKTTQVLENSKNYELFLVENFLGFDYWQILSSSSFLNRLKVVDKFPDLNSYTEESKSFKISNSKKSLMLHTFLENPTRNAFFIKPRTKIRFNLGLPVQVILWVYSNNYNTSMKLILTQEKHPDMKVELGDLNFKGWKRIQKPVVISKRNYKSNLMRKNPIYLDRLYFHPKHNQKKGDFFIYITRIKFILDKTRMRQVNIEIRDEW